MARLSLMVGLLVLQCIWFSWCSATDDNLTYKIASFKRQGKENGFLKDFVLSYTGNRTDPETTFIFKRKKTNINGSREIFYTIHPATRPNYFLAVDRRRLVVKNSTTDPVTNNNNLFWLSRIDLYYSNQGTENLHVIMSKATRFVIKSNRHGKVSLSLNWKDCGAWVRLVDESNAQGN